MTEASAEFREAWSKHDVRLPATGTHRFHHRRVGVLDLVVVSAVLRADPALTLLLATAETGSPSDTALRQLETPANQSETEQPRAPANTQHPEAP
jgi:hypothetical protein